MNVMRRAVVCVYHEMQQHYVTFRILTWMKELGVARKVSTWVANKGAAPSGRQIQAMHRSKAFFADNAERAEKVLALLADDKSRAVWKGVVQHRAENAPIKPELYSENDQYFIKGLVKVDENEVFIDGGGTLAIRRNSSWISQKSRV